MELKHDWKALNDVLFMQQSMAANASTLVLLEDDHKIIDGVVSSGKAFTDVGGEPVSSSKEKLDAMATSYGTDQAVVLSKKELDQFIAEAATLGTNYFQQLQTLRTKVLGEANRSRRSSGGKASTIVSRRHFVLDLFGTKLRRILPRRFNVLVFVDQRPSQASLGFTDSSAPSNSVAPFSYRAILLSYADGQLDQFFEPDFSSLHQNRLARWQHEADTIGQYLETRYILPCYGLFMFKEDWEHCLASAVQKAKPWRLFTKYNDEGRAAAYPRGMTTKALLATQRLMVYFGRLS